MQPRLLDRDVLEVVDLRRVDEAEDRADALLRVRVGDLPVGQQLDLLQLLVDGHLAQQAVDLALDAAVGGLARRLQRGLVVDRVAGDHRAATEHAHYDDRRDDRGSTSPRSHVTLPPDVPPAGPAAPGVDYPGAGGANLPRRAATATASRKDRVAGGVCTPMRGLSPLLALAAGLLVAAPAVAADHLVTFAPYAYSDPTSWSRAATRSPSAARSRTTPWYGSAATSPPRATGRRRQFAFPRPGTYAYYCLLHGDSRGMRGTVRVPGDQHPARVSFAASPAAPQPGEPVTFTYTGDPDPDGTLVRWQWDLDGDGSLETATTTPSATHTYASAGAVTVRVQAVDDGHEGSAVAEQVLTVALPAAGAPAAGDQVTPPRRERRS